MAYAMPLSAGDLNVGERFSTFTHVAGIQGEGKDIGGRRHRTGSDWRQLLSDNADKKVLTNWVIYGKPFYAMASGTVVGAWRNAPENTPGSLHADIEMFAGGGNHLWILQDDGVYALYAHAMRESIPSELCPHNATLFSTPATGAVVPGPDIDPQVAVTHGAEVKAGQFLGRVGNSGASRFGPHLHVHMEKGGIPTEMKFAKGLTTSYEDEKATFRGPWAPVAGQALPPGPILVWPPRAVGNYTFKGTPSAELQALVDHMADSGMLPDTISCKNGGATYDSNWIPAKGAWLWFAGATAAAEIEHKKYVAGGFKRTSSYTCGPTTVCVWRE